MLRGLDAGRLDFDRDRPLRQRSEARRDLEHEIDPDVAGHGVPDRALHLGRVPWRMLDDPPYHGAGRTAAHNSPDEDQEVRAQVLEPLGDGDGAVMELLDAHARAEILGRQPLDGAPAQVEIALVQLSDPANENLHALSSFSQSER